MKLLTIFFLLLLSSSLFAQPRITVERYDLATVQRICNYTNHPASSVVACSFPPWVTGNPRKCRVVLSPFGHLEHELAHCYGKGYD